MLRTLLAAQAEELSELRSRYKGYKDALVQNARLIAGHLRKLPQTPDLDALRGLLPSRHSIYERKAERLFHAFPAEKSYRLESTGYKSTRT